MLLRVPERLEDELERQDEFECLNLTITVPGDGKGDKMPVLVWVHGMYAFIYDCWEAGSDEVTGHES